MARRPELARDSIAAIVLDTQGGARRVPSRPRSSAPGRGGPAEIVLGSRRAPSTARLSLAIAAASALHGGVGLAALRAASRGGHQAPTVRTPPPLRIDHIVDLAAAAPEPPAPPSPAPEPPAAVAPTRVRPARVDRAPAAPRATAPAQPEDAPPPPAQAGQAVVVDDSASQPLDFTGFDLSTGSGHYAGGVTAASGTSTRAVHARDVDRNTGSDRGQGATRARPVGLPSVDWRCPWPHEADQLSIDERIVVIRVVVRPDGSVSSAELVTDPGFGFGAVALDCARSHRFPPATDDSGRAITATSPPLRIKFIRD